MLTPDTDQLANDFITYALSVDWSPLTSVSAFYTAYKIYSDAYYSAQCSWLPDAKTTSQEEAQDVSTVSDQDSDNSSREFSITNSPAASECDSDVFVRSSRPCLPGMNNPPGSCSPKRITRWRTLPDTSPPSDGSGLPRFKRLRYQDIHFLTFMHTTFIHTHIYIYIYIQLKSLIFCSNVEQYFILLFLFLLYLYVWTLYVLF